LESPYLLNRSGEAGDSGSVGFQGLHSVPLWWPLPSLAEQAVQCAGENPVANTPPAPMKTGAMKPRLFLADDNPFEGMLLELGFAEAGRSVEIVQALDGAQACDLLQLAATEVPFSFGLIVIDLNLPKVSGWELFDRLGAWPALAGVPMVILTSSTDPGYRLRSFKISPPNAFLIKPEGYDELAGVIEQIVPFLFPDDLAGPQAPSRRDRGSEITDARPH